MYIGKAAKLCGVSVKTIRYYESLGLLPNVERQGAYRVFSERDIRLIRLIRQAQASGFRLSELKAALASNHHTLPWNTLCQLMQQKEADIEREIEQLQRKTEQLRRQRKDIEACLAETPDCPPLLP